MKFLAACLAFHPARFPLTANGLLFATSIQGKTSLFLHSFSSPEGKTIDLHVDGQLIGWSPDNQWMAVQEANGTISVLHPDGSEEPPGIQHSERKHNGALVFR